MKQFVIALTFVALAVTPGRKALIYPPISHYLGIVLYFVVLSTVTGCYYGWTQDDDEDPEDDWDEKFCNDGDRTYLNCVGAACEGRNAACFKVKYSE